MFIKSPMYLFSLEEGTEGREKVEEGRGGVGKGACRRGNGGAGGREIGRGRRHITLIKKKRKFSSYIRKFIGIGC
jgi:hypothetical protein